MTLITLKFSMREYQKIKSKNRLSKTSIDLLHLMNKYEKKYDLKDEIIVDLVDDQLQMIEKEKCVIHQIYFYVSVFNSLENSSIINEKILNKQAIGKLLNKISSTDRHKNENRTEQFTEESDIQFG